MREAHLTGAGWTSAASVKRTDAARVEFGESPVEASTELRFDVDPNADVAFGVETGCELEDGTVMEEWDYSDLNPTLATYAKPGSEDKVRMLSARYAAGVPLWHTADCYDHGPTNAAALLGEELA